jgi:RNA polymerase sigma-70 factor (ECF subfamily)
MLDEKEIIKRILLGDREVFGEIILKYQDFVFNVIRSYVKIEEDAKDITQEVFIRAYKGIERFKGDSKISSWLYRIACNLSLNWLNRNRSTDYEINEEVVENLEDETDQYDRIFEKELIVKEVDRIIDALPLRYKIVIKLYYFEDKSYKEISEILKLPQNTVKTYLFRAKKMVEKLLFN